MSSKDDSEIYDVTCDRCDFTWRVVVGKSGYFLAQEAADVAHGVRGECWGNSEGPIVIKLRRVEGY